MTRAVPREAPVRGVPALATSGVTTTTPPTTTTRPTAVTTTTAPAGKPGGYAGGRRRLKRAPVGSVTEAMVP